MKAPRVALVGLKLEPNRCSRPADIGDAHTVIVKSRGHFRAGFDLWFAPEKTFEIDPAGLSSPVLDRWNFNHIKRPSYPMDKDTVWPSPESIMNNEA